MPAYCAKGSGMGAAGPAAPAYPLHKPYRAAPLGAAPFSFPADFAIIVPSTKDKETRPWNF